MSIFLLYSLKYLNKKYTEIDNINNIFFKIQSNKINTRLSYLSKIYIKKQQIRYSYDTVIWIRKEHKIFNI